MIWVVVFGVIALLGLIMTIMYAVWLWHKVSDLFSEVQMLGARASEFADLVSQIGVSVADRAVERTPAQR